MIVVRLFLAIAVAAWAADPAPIAGLGMISADEKLIFLPAKDGGIEALELSTGTLRWTNKSANRIAGASAKFVYAWIAGPGSGVRVMAIDAATGKSIGKPCPISLPDWVSTSGGLGRSFQLAARPEGTAAVVVWQANASYAGGANPSREIEAASRKNESGMFTLDFAMGKAVPGKGKPSGNDFSRSPGNSGNGKVGEYEIEVSKKTQRLPHTFRQVRVVELQVKKGERELWTRELASESYLPPPP